MSITNYSLVITQRHWSSWVQHFGGTRSERMAYGYCGVNVTREGVEFLVRDVDLPDDGEYGTQTGIGISLSAEHVVPRVLRARKCNAFVDLHSHPFTSHPAPSSTDQLGADEQLRVLSDLAPGVRLVRLVFGAQGRVWAEAAGPQTKAWTPLRSIVVLGAARREIIRPVNAPKQSSEAISETDLRTAAVLGVGSASTIHDTEVLVIGAGGVGSAVIAQLRGYVNKLTIVDPDVVELHNAPRLYHYAAGDAGRAKVEVHQREIRRAFPDTRVEILRASFPSEGTLDLFKRAAFVFCCPDHNAVRYAAAVAGARFMKPVIEVGCGGRRVDGQIAALGYHVRVQVPGKACLACNGLDLSQLEDPASTEMKSQAGYVTDGDLVAGELMPLTSRAASDAVDLFFRYMTGYTDFLPRHLYFDALRFHAMDLTDVYRPNPACTVCGLCDESIAGAGDVLTTDQVLLPRPAERVNRRVQPV